MLKTITPEHSTGVYQGMILFAALGLASCGCNNGGLTHLSSTPALTAAVDGVRTGLEVTLGKPVPSLSVLIETPTGSYFTTSVATGVTPVTPDTYFRFASNTKNFTAAAVMKMNQDGWLNYTDRIVDTIPGTTVTYVPQTPDWAVPNKDTITIRHLLQHSAGVYDVGNDPVPGCHEGYEDCQLAKDPSHQFTSSELVGQVAVNGLSYFVPGAGHHYSNTGYTMLSEIIARTYTQHGDGTLRTYADYLRDHIIGPGTPVPLDVRFPDLADDQNLPRPRVCGTIYYPNNDMPVSCDANISAKVAEGNGYGTLRMLNHWVRSLFSGHNVLSAQTLELMKTDISPGDATYALGTLSVKNLGYGHNGATLGYLSFMAYDPALQVSVVVMLPMWDLTEGTDSFMKVVSALTCAGWGARSALGFPGKPDGAICAGG